MYGEEIPKRPVGFGFGVKASSVFGVHGMLRKSGCSGANTSQMEVAFATLMKQHQELQKRNEMLESKFDKNQQAMMQKILLEMRNHNGHISDECLNRAQSALHKDNTQVPDASIGYDARTWSQDDGRNGFYNGSHSGSDRSNADDDDSPSSSYS